LSLLTRKNILNKRLRQHETTAPHALDKPEVAECCLVFREQAAENTDQRNTQAHDQDAPASISIRERAGNHLGQSKTKGEDSDKHGHLADGYSKESRQRGVGGEHDVHGQSAEHNHHG